LNIVLSLIEWIWKHISHKRWRIYIFSI
jgi:hypothetical protein